MLTKSGVLLLHLFAALSVNAHEHPGSLQEPLAAQGPHRESLWYNSLPGDGGTQADSVFSGISTFGRLPYFPCLASDKEKFDIAFLGIFCFFLSLPVELALGEYI